MRSHDFEWAGRRYSLSIEGEKLTSISVWIPAKGGRAGYWRGIHMHGATAYRIKEAFLNNRG